MKEYYKNVHEKAIRDNLFKKHKYIENVLQEFAVVFERFKES